MHLKAFLAKNRLNLSLAIASILVSVFLAEIAFRVHLYRMIDKSQYDHVDFDVVSRSYSEYDEALGFHYKPSVSADWCSIQDSLPYLAGTVSLNRRGNSGPEVDEAGSEIKIALAGDSFSMIQHDGVTWPHLMQEELRKSTGRKVAVLNYARDGYGILQMIDQASVLVDEKPDVILIAFITPDLVRSRFWRMERETPGGTELFTSITPTLQIDKPDTYTRTALINPLATRDWAEGLIASRDRNDPLLRSVTDTYLREKKNHAITRFDPFSLRRLYLWERIANPAVQAGSFFNAEIAYRNFVQDGQFLSAVAKIRRSGIPVYLIHLPFYPDLAAGQFQVDSDLSKLLKSLKSTTGFPFVEIRPPLAMGRHADIMILSPQNLHPSKHGLNFYATQVAEALLRESVIGNRLHPAGRGRD
jgi:hypothetical protein